MPSLLEHQLDDLRQQFARMAARVQQAVERTVRAVLDGDDALVGKIVKADRRIDSEEVALEKAAIDVLALQRPAAGDLRRVTTIIKANADLERVGDCAVNAAEAAAPLNAARRDDRLPPVKLPADLRALAEGAVTQIADAIAAFNLGDAEAARRVIAGDDRIDALYHETLQALLARLPDDAREHEHRVQQDVAIITIAKNLERIGDHATNLAEDVLYVETGQIVRHRGVVVRAG